MSKANGARRLQELEAGHARHALIGDDDGDVVLFEQLQRLVAGAGGVDLEHAAEVEAKGV